MAQKSKTNKKRKNKRSPKKLKGSKAKVSLAGVAIEPIKELSMEHTVEDLAPAFSVANEPVAANQAAVDYLEKNVLPAARKAQSFMGMVSVKVVGGSENRLLTKVSQVEELLAEVKSGKTELDLSFIPSAAALDSMSRNERPSELVKEEASVTEEPKRGLLHKIKHAAKKLVGK